MIPDFTRSAITLFLSIHLWCGPNPARPLPAFNGNIAQIDKTSKIAAVIYLPCAENEANVVIEKFATFQKQSSPWMRASTRQLGNFKGRNGSTPDSLHNPLIRHHRIIVSRHSIAAKYHRPQSNVSEPWPGVIKVPVKYHRRHFPNWATSSDW